MLFVMELPTFGHLTLLLRVLSLSFALFFPQRFFPGPLSVCNFRHFPLPLFLRQLLLLLATLNIPNAATVHVVGVGHNVIVVAWWLARPREGLVVTRREATLWNIALSFACPVHAS